MSPNMSSSKYVKKKKKKTVHTSALKNYQYFSSLFVLMLFQRVTGHWIYAAVVGFSTYFCAYGFRKPFRAALYSDLAIFDGKLPFKTAMAVAQLMGTFIATLIGIKYVSEVPRRGYARSIALISLVLVNHYLFQIEYLTSQQLLLTQLLLTFLLPSSITN